MLHTIHVFNSSVVSGPETLVFPQLRQFSEEHGVSTHLILLVEQRRSLESQQVIEYAQQCGCEYTVIEVAGRFDARAILKLAEVIQQQKAKIVHAHDVKASTYVLAAAKKIQDKTFKIVSTHHGVRNRPWVRTKIYAWFYEYFILPRYDLVLAVCSSDEQLLKAKGIKKIRTHPNGVDRELVSVDQKNSCRARVGKELKISNNTCILLYVGRVEKEKGIVMLLDVFAEIQKRKDSEVCLVIAGKGSFLEASKEYAHAAGISQSTHFLGYRQDVTTLLASASCVLSFSPAEGLPITLLEAGFARTPVAAISVDGIKDLLPDERYGLPLTVGRAAQDYAAQIVELLQDEKKRETISKNYTQRIIEQYSGKRWRQTLAEIYNSL